MKKGNKKKRRSDEATERRREGLAGCQVEPEGRDSFPPRRLNREAGGRAIDGAERRSDGATERRREETDVNEWAARIQSVLDETEGPLRRVIVLEETGSTQDAAVQRRAGSGDVVVAARQTAGRGRLGRAWADTADQGIAVTFVVAAGPPQRLGPAAAIGAALGAEALLGRAAGLKWPNDVVVDGRKLAGVLIEQADGLARIGIGLNVRQASWPPQLAGRAVSIAQLGGRSDRLEAIVELTRAMNGALRLDDEQLRREFRRRDVLSGTRTTLRCGARTVTGTVLECDPHRGLRVDVEGEVICLPAETTTVLAAADGANDISCRDQEVPAKGRDALKRD